MERLMRGPAIVVATVVMAAGMVGCGSVGIEPDVEDIVGGWVWVQSEGGVVPEVRTPEGTGQTGAVHFGADGVVAFYTDGEVLWSAPYQVGIGGEGTQFEGRTVVRYVRDAGDAEQGLELTGPTLLLDEGCCDRFVHTYVRDEP